MENASKALLMAASILIAILVIGILVTGYRQMSAAEQQRLDVEEAKKVIDYNKQFEQYNKNIYGSELLSLGNLKLDYNRIQAELKTYERIDVFATFNANVEDGGTVYIAQGRRTIEQIQTGIRNLETDIAYYENRDNGKQAEKDRIKRSIKAYAQYNNRQLADLFNVPFSSNDTEMDIIDKLTLNPNTSSLWDQIDKYRKLKTLLTEVKRKKFSVTNVKYGDTGRVVRMEYAEI